MAVNLLAALYPQKDSWYSFLLEAESPQGHSVAGRIRPIEKFNDLDGNRTRDLLACSIVPEPTYATSCPNRQKRNLDKVLGSKPEGEKPLRKSIKMCLIGTMCEGVV
jgi:hypothetical protein